MVNRLWDRPRNSGSVYAGWDPHIQTGYVQDTPYHVHIDLMLSRGKKYGGDARRPFKTVVNRGRYSRPYKALKFRGRANGMKIIKGCFVCRKDHMEIDHHPKGCSLRRNTKIECEILASGIRIIDRVSITL